MVNIRSGTSDTNTHLVKSSNKKSRSNNYEYHNGDR